MTTRNHDHVRILLQTNCARIFGLKEAYTYVSVLMDMVANRTLGHTVQNLYEDINNPIKLFFPIVRRQHWSLLKFWSSFAKKLVIRQKIGHHSPATLVIHLPKNWSFAKILARLITKKLVIRQNFGLSFAKKLVIHLPKFWPD